MRLRNNLTAWDRPTSLPRSNLGTYPRRSWAQIHPPSSLPLKEDNLISPMAATTQGRVSQRAFLLHMGIGTGQAACPERTDLLGEAAALPMDALGMSRVYEVMDVADAASRAAGADGVWPFAGGTIQEVEAVTTCAPDQAQDPLKAGATRVGGP